jgi:hypothetical protein
MRTPQHVPGHEVPEMIRWDFGPDFPDVDRDADERFQQQDIDIDAPSGSDVSARLSGSFLETPMDIDEQSTQSTPLPQDPLGEGASDTDGSIDEFLADEAAHSKANQHPARDTTMTDANSDDDEFADALDDGFSAKSDDDNGAPDTTMPASNVSDANTYVPPMASKLVMDGDPNRPTYKPIQYKATREALYAAKFAQNCLARNLHKVIKGPTRKKFRGRLFNNRTLNCYSSYTNFARVCLKLVFVAQLL